MFQEPYPDQHAIKGSVHVVTAEHVRNEYGAGAFERIVRELSPVARMAFSDPIASAWYPESTHAEVVNALLEQLFAGDHGRLTEFIRRNTGLGLGRFASAVLSMPSPLVVVRQLPRLTHLVRRGPIECAVEPDGDECLAHWRRFPFFATPAYASTFVGTVKALLEPSTPYPVRVTVESCGQDFLTLRLRARSKPSTIPPPASGFPSSFPPPL